MTAGHIISVYAAGVLSGVGLVLLTLWLWVLADEKRQDRSAFGDHDDYAENPHHRFP